MPSFCSDCGERLKSTRAGFWPLRARCYYCDPGVRRGRLLLSGLLALSLTAGFVLGRYTRRPEPFYFIGTRVEPRSLPDVSSAENGNQERPPANADMQKGGGRAIESICGATTRAGKPCKRKVKGGGFCWQHRGQEPKK